MSISTFRLILLTLVEIVVLVFILAIGWQNNHIDNYIKYDCDVRHSKTSINIDIRNDNQFLYTVIGQKIHFKETPLTMTNPQNTKIVYSSDNYNLFSNDSHSIVIDDSEVIEMVGLANLFGNDYNLYDKEGNKIAYINASGNLYTQDKKLIATLKSSFFFNNFTVKISEECEFDHAIILMIFSIYYTDQKV